MNFLGYLGLGLAIFTATGYIIAFILAAISVCLGEDILHPDEEVIARGYC